MTHRLARPARRRRPAPSAIVAPGRERGGRRAVQHVARAQRVDDVRGGDGRRVQDRRRPSTVGVRPSGPGPGPAPADCATVPRPEVRDAVEQVARRAVRAAGSPRTAPRGRRARAAVQPGLPAAAVEQHGDARARRVGGEHPRGPEVVAVDEQRGRARRARRAPRAAARSGPARPIALTETTARSPVARRHQHGRDGRRVPRPVEQVDDLDPRGGEPGADEVGDRSASRAPSPAPCGPRARPPSPPRSPPDRRT